VLALGIVFGAAPRLSAIALFALSIMTHWAILPIVSIDDYVANVVLGFLSLLPIGTTLCLRSIRNAWLRGTSSPVCGVAASILLLQSSFLYLSGRIGDLCGANPSASQFVAVVSQLIPVCYVLPTFTFKKLGLLLQLGIHTYLAATTGVIVANLLLAATALLFWRESQSTPRPKVHVDAGGMTAMTYVLIALMRMAGPPLRSNAMADGAEQLLADLALMPQMLRFPAGRPDASLVLMATGTDGGNGENVDYKHVARGNRVDLLLARLAGPPSDPLRIALVSGLANRYCREHVSLGHKGTFLLSSLQGQSPLAEFKCGDLGGVVYLR
jgi:hypothetical protein